MAIAGYTRTHLDTLGQTWLDVVNKAPPVQPPRGADWGGDFSFAMTARRYALTKPFLSIEEQINQLKLRGLQIPDEAAARAFLSRVNYARLRPYWHPFEIPGDANHRFQPGTTFEDVVRLYEFDRALRLHVLAAIERIEIGLRTRWAYHLSEQFGPFGYLEPGLYKETRRFYESLCSLNRNWAKQKDYDPILQHFDRDYAEPLPPAWLACELMTLGELSYWIKNLDRDQPRLRPVFEGLKKGLGIPAGVIISLLPHLTHVRNLAAHHTRLWDRKLTAYSLTKTFPRGPTDLLVALQATPPGREQYIYRTLVVLGYLAKRMTPGCNWIQELCALIKRYRPLLDRMGFPENWQELTFWGNCK